MNSNKDNNNKKPLSVDSLYNTFNIDTTDTFKFDINGLKNKKEEKKKKLYLQYKKILTQCLKKIDMANKFNKSDLIYELPRAIFMLPEYDCKECVKLIDNYLKKMNIEAFILTENSIYISWSDLSN